MNFKELNGKTIVEAFAEFDAEYPDVYAHIKGQALKAIRAGRSRISFKAIVYWIRWNVFLAADDASSDYKINDAYISHYARKFIAEYPEHEKTIELRRLTAEVPKPEPRGMLF